MTTTDADLRALCEEVRAKLAVNMGDLVDGPGCPCSVCFAQRAAPRLAGECERLLETRREDLERLACLLSVSKDLSREEIEGSVVGLRERAEKLEALLAPRIGAEDRSPTDTLRRWLARADRVVELEAEVERLRIEHGRAVQREREEGRVAQDRVFELRTRVRELEAVIEAAPHDLHCDEWGLGPDGATRPCDCWKASALAPAGAERSEGK